MAIERKLWVRSGLLALGLLAAALLLLSLPNGGGAVAAARGKAAHRAGSASVKIKSFSFRPGRLVIRRGTRVKFVNRDRVAHTATRRGSFDTGTIRPGRSVKVRFRHRGKFRYHCEFHPDMRGTIVVR